VVVEVGGEGSRALPPARAQAPLPPQMRQHEGRRPLCRAEVLGTREGLPGAGEGGEGQAVPGGEHLVVGGRTHACGARGEELLPERCQARRVRGLPFQMVGDARALEVPFAGDPPGGARDERVLGAEDLLHLVRGPDVEASLVPFAVRVQAGPEAPVGVRQLAPHEVERLLHDAAIERLAGEEPRVHVGGHEQGLVVQHLLEVGDEPALVRAVAGEPAPDLVEQAAQGHGIERALGHAPRHRLAGAGVLAKQQLDGAVGRELGGGAEAAPAGIEAGGELGGGRGGLGAPGGRARHGGRTPQLLEVHRHVGGGALHLLAPGSPDLVQAGQDGPEARPPVPLVRGPVGPAVEGASVGCEEHVQRPASLAGEELHGRHVDLVEIGPLLPVHLDGDEPVVEERCRHRVLERLPLHDVAPVAGRVADGEEDRPVQQAGAGEGSLTPGLPVHRVVQVLQEIRARLAGQAVGLARGRGRFHG
jgi:hypothetical protein